MEESNETRQELPVFNSRSNDATRRTSGMSNICMSNLTVEFD